MTDQPKILAFSGSTRDGSFNRKLLDIACDGARAEGAEVTLIDLRDYALPLYDGDVEAAGFPENAVKLKQLFVDHQGLLIASPEYNGGYSAVLKNVIDWVSRPDATETVTGDPFGGKTAVIISAAAGGFGGLRGLTQLREILMNLKVMVLPDMGMISKAYEAFDETGALANERHHANIKSIGAGLVGKL